MPSFCHVTEIFVSFEITWHSTPKVTPRSTITFWGFVVTLIEEWPEKKKKWIQDNFVSEMQAIFFLWQAWIQQKNKRKKYQPPGLNIFYVSASNIKAKSKIKPNPLMK